MSVSGLNSSSQNYLKVVWTLGEWSDEPVTIAAVASRLELRRSTVSDAIRKLANQGLVEHEPYGAVHLTAAGLQHAMTMVRRHRLIETFLVEVLGYSWDEVHDEAEELEHAVSELMIERIDTHLGRPRRDPHGDPIPGADGGIARLAAWQLSEAEPGPHRVVRISDEKPELLQQFSDDGIVLDASLQIDEADELGVRLHTAADQELVINPVAASAIWVTNR